jgi:filamentous hemagglutinin
MIKNKIKNKTTHFQKVSLFHQNKRSHFQECQKCKRKLNSQSFIRAFSTAIIFAAYSCQSSFLNPLIVYAQTTAYQNAPSGQKPIMDAAHNGVPIVDIAPPNSSGVSHNQFGDFNVNSEGMILNNSGNDIETKLAGWIAANPQLGNLPANIILNEIMSSNPSHLNGALEIAGQNAELIIANPNGITCNGCGFINTSRASLIVGRPEFNQNGMIEAFQTANGLLTIGEKGLNALNIARLDLIARSMEVNGEVWANQLNTVLGSNRVHYQSLQSSPIYGKGNTPHFALDIKAMGGMFARQVYIVATEKGLGVNSEGQLAALNGNLTLAVNGDLKIREAFAKHNMNITSHGNTTLLGKLSSEGNTNIFIDKSFYQNGHVDSKGLLKIQALNLHNNGTIFQSGKEKIEIKSKELFHNTGNIYSAGKLDIKADHIKDEGGRIKSEGGILFDSKTTNLVNSVLESKNNIHLNSVELNNKSTGISSEKDINIYTNGKFTHYLSYILAGQNVGIQSQSVENKSGIISAINNVNMISK